MSEFKVGDWVVSERFSGRKQIVQIETGVLSGRVYHHVGGGDWELADDLKPAPETDVPGWEYYMPEPVKRAVDPNTPTLPRETFDSLIRTNGLMAFGGWW